MRIGNLNLTKNIIDDEKLLNLIEVDKERLYRIAYAYVKNEDDAKEIVQEAVYKAFVNIKKLKTLDSFQGWITRILVNSSLDFIKKRNRVTLVTDEVLINSPSSDKDYLDLYEAMDNLPVIEKTVIILKYFEDYKIKDIAVILKLSESQVKNHLHSSLKKLRIELLEETVPLPSNTDCNTASSTINHPKNYCKNL